MGINLLFLQVRLLVDLQHCTEEHMSRLPMTWNTIRYVTYFSPESWQSCCTSVHSSYLVKPLLSLKTGVEVAPVIFCCTLGLDPIPAACGCHSHSHSHLRSAQMHACGAWEEAGVPRCSRGLEDRTTPHKSPHGIWTFNHCNTIAKVMSCRFGGSDNLIGNYYNFKTC